VLSDDEKALLNNELDTLRPSVYQGSLRNPDDFAESLRLSEKKQLPIDTVERSKDQVKRIELIDTVDSLRDTNPKLSGYMSDPERASLSHDDLSALKGLEDAFKPKRSFLDNQWRGLFQSTNKLTGDFLEFLGRTSDSFTDRITSLGIPNPGIVFGEDGISFTLDLPDDMPNRITQLGEVISDPAINPYDYQPDFTWEKLKGDITPTNLAGYIAEQGVQSVPHMLAALHTLPAYVASRTEDIAETRVENDKRTDVTEDDLLNAFIPATLSALVERFSAKVVFDVGGAKTLKEAGKKALMAGAVEGTTEAIQESIEYLGETVGTEKPVELAEMGERALAGSIAGFGMGTGIRGTTATVEAVISKSERDVKQQAKSVDEQATLDDIITYAQEAKTSQRSSKHFRDYVESISDQSVYVAEDVITGLEVIPPALEERITGAGTEIAIPMGEFLTETVNDQETLGQIREHLRFTPDGLTQAELNQTDTSLEDMVTRALEERQTESEIDMIYEDVKDQIKATGRQADVTAKYSAELIPAYVKAKAEETGLSPMEIYESIGLEIVGPEGVVTGDALNQIPTTQDFGDVEIEQERKVAETGDTVKIKQKAQKVFDRTAKRRDVIQKLLGCLND